MHINLALRSFTPSVNDLTLSVYVYEEPDRDFYSFIKYTCKKGKIISVEHELPKDIEILLPLLLDVLDKPKAILAHGITTYNLIYS